MLFSFLTIPFSVLDYPFLGLLYSLHTIHAKWLVTLPRLGKEGQQNVIVDGRGFEALLDTALGRDIFLQFHHLLSSLSLFFRVSISALSSCRCHFSAVSSLLICVVYIFDFIDFFSLAFRDVVWHNIGRAALGGRVFFLFFKAGMDHMLLLVVVSKRRECGKIFALVVAVVSVFASLYLDTLILLLISLDWGYWGHVGY